MITLVAVINWFGWFLWSWSWTVIACSGSVGQDLTDRSCPTTSASNRWGWGTGEQLRFTSSPISGHLPGSMVEQWVHDSRSGSAPVIVTRVRHNLSHPWGQGRSSSSQAVNLQVGAQISRVNDQAQAWPWYSWRQVKSCSGRNWSLKSAVPVGRRCGSRL